MYFCVEPKNGLLWHFKAVVTFKGHDDQNGGHFRTQREKLHLISVCFKIYYCGLFWPLRPSGAFEVEMKAIFGISVQNYIRKVGHFVRRVLLEVNPFPVGLEGGILILRAAPE